MLLLLSNICCNLLIILKEGISIVAIKENQNQSLIFMPKINYFSFFIINNNYQKRITIIGSSM